jgi:hypothetical protein
MPLRLDERELAPRRRPCRPAMAALVALAGLTVTMAACQDAAPIHPASEAPPGHTFVAVGARHQASIDGSFIAISARSGEPTRSGFLPARLAGLATTTRVLPESRDEQVLIDRGWARESLTSGPEGLEQAWTFAARPRVAALDLCVPTVGLTYVGSDERGVAMRIDGASTIVRFGHGSWVSGRTRVDVPAEHTGDCIRLRVPAAVLDASTYPAVLDPLIGIEYRLPTENPTGEASGDQIYPRLAQGTSSHLVVWSDTRDGSAFPSVFGVVREQSTSVVDQTGFRLGSGRLSATPVRPAVAFQSGVYAVAWATFDTVFLARVDESGHVLDAPARALDVGGSVDSLSIAGRDGHFLVAWMDGSSGHDRLRVLRVGADGVALDGAPRTVLDDDFDERELSLRASPDGYWLVFSDTRSGARHVRLVRLDPGGTMLDPAPITVEAGAAATSSPDVAFDAQGAGVIVWADTATQAVHGARVTTTPGVAVGTTTRITGGSGERSPRIAFDGDRFTLVMSSSVCGSGPCAAALRLPASGPQRVDPVTLGQSWCEGVDVGARGSLVEAVWDEKNRTTLSTDVHMKADPTDPGQLVDLVSRAADTQFSPLATAMSSRFYASWITLHPDRQQVYGSRFTSLGEPEDAAPIALSRPAFRQQLLGTASLGSSAVVVWNQLDTDPTLPGPINWFLQAARVDAAGASIDAGGLQLDGSSSPFVGDVWIDASVFPVRYMITYDAGGVLYDQPLRATGTPGIPIFVAQDVSLQGAPWLRSTAKFIYFLSAADHHVHRIDRGTGANEIYDALPATASSVSVTRGANQHALVYQDNDGASPRVALLVHDDAGALKWRLPELATGSTTLAPRITTVPGGYLVTWREGGGIVGQRVAASGLLMDAAPVTLSNEPGIEVQGSMPTDFSGQTLLVYHRYVGELGVQAFRIGMRVIDSRFHSGGANGASCTSGFACASGNCVDGVCCDTTCGFGDPSDCQACAAALGASQDGSCGLLDAAHVCRTADGPCDVAETCAGAAACPADALRPSGTACGAPAAGPCDAQDACDGASSACPDLRRPAGDVCRASAGDCDLDERCDGASIECPADTLVVAGTVCRGAAGACDVDERCDGATASCPADAVAAPGTTCRAPAGACDVAEQCDGAATTCPADVLAVAGTVCRPAEGACDLAETCSGTSGACGLDRVADPGVVCRPANGTCDAEESCTGAAKTCPADVALADGSSCGSGPSCDGVATCQAGACQPPSAPLCGAGFTCEEATATCVPLPTDPADGCGCHVGGRPASGRSVPALGLCLSVLLVLLRRRRRAVG